MSLLFETIRIVNGEIKNLEYHNDRCKSSLESVLGLTQYIQLKDYISIPSYYKRGLVKCRISYNSKIINVSYEHYNPRSINSIKVVEADQVEYPFKYEDRTQLKTLFHSRQGHSEILIIKDSMVTDCFYYNVAFFDGHTWWTPSSPLLPGTMRAKLLDDKLIAERSIKRSDLSRFKKIRLFNALNVFGSVELEMDQLYY